MLADRKRLTLVPNLPDLFIQTPTLVNDSLLKPPTPTSNDSSLYRLQHRRNPSMPHPVTPSSPLTPSTPRSPLHHHRRRTYGGDVSPTTRTPLLNVEEKIALLESTNKRLSVELEETRDALLTERDGRITYSQSQATTPTQTPVQSEVAWERKLRMEMLEALKKVRTQNTVLSRSVREHQEHCESLSSLLAEERAQREAAEDELSRLAQVNFTLFEHNKLLVERDLAFQKMTSSPHPGDPLEFQNLKPADDDSLRTQLNAATDELHITKLRLAASEEKCSDLSEHVSFLQKQMTQCLDSSAQALEVERELRAEFMGRTTIAVEENERLRAQIGTVERQLHSSRPSVRRVVALPERITIRLQRRRQRKILVSTFIAHQEKSIFVHSPKPSSAPPGDISRVPETSDCPPMPPSLRNLFRTVPSCVPPPVLSEAVAPAESASLETALDSPESVASTLVSYDDKTLYTNKRASVLLTATLRRKPASSASALKAVSTCSINVINTCITDHVDGDGVTAKLPALMQKVSTNRASIALADIALQDAGWEVINEVEVL